LNVVRCARVPTLKSPIALLSFGGWGDAAQAASTAVTTLNGEWSAQQFATIDPEEFYDFTEVRPRVYLDRSMVREIEWPVATFSYRRRAKADRDVVLFRAFEPQLRWRTYAAGILDFFEKLQVHTMISLGALLADVPHTKSVHLTGFASTEDLQQRLQLAGVAASQYEGPTGIVGVLHDAARRRDIPSASLWAAAPHYIAAAANPKVALALLDTLGSILSWDLDLSTLRQEAKEFQVEVDAIIGRNPEASAYVKRLEERVEEDDGGDSGPPPPASSDLLQDLEEFLRRGREKPRGDA
jgi:predicted ATP-grasp superfamily ATP-dependent carboligase